METTTFERELQGLDPAFRIIVNPNLTDIAGVYWNGTYLFAVPPKEIFEDTKSNYQDAAGNVHRSRTDALAMAKHFLWRLQNDPGFLEDMTEPV